MSRKTEKFGVAAIAGALITTFALAESSGAVASGYDADAQPVNAEAVTSGAALTTERMPVFVAEEVVQPVPEPEETLPEDNETEIEQETLTASSLSELVSAMPTQASLNSEMECLAGAVYFEARGEPLAGQLAVARVVMNRSESSRFPSGYCGVVFQRSQFSFVKGGSMPRIRRGTSAWHRAKAIATIAHQDLWESEAQDSLYFHAKYVQPSWARKKTKRASIKTHIFYR